MHPLDGYLLDGSPTKAEAIAAALREHSDVEQAQPFYRALEVLGARAADESLIALRVALGGRTPDDETIRRLRAAIAGARGGDLAARQAYLAEVETR